eukprot:CAMPEP_0118981704 /NCGR_PEP_ID=MMETSP1173-20130426/31136_1 /TAXON_ID=1034831 /ORGANISM="Rhizochromulina marina cf, Strain CCMP1243" /LENGTH=205 /DNA_ID=CAMNT_0006932147 /DNA_START=72 /DNA_END=689 /DNA_ORIENTATION=+
MDPTVQKAQDAQQQQPYSAVPVQEGMGAPLVANAVTPYPSYVVQEPGAVVGDVMPPPLEGSQQEFNYTFCGRCCSCDTGCLMAWFCACFPVAQMLEKLKLAGMPLCMDYRSFLITWVVLLVVGVVLGILVGGGNFDFASLLLMVVLVQIRGSVRLRYGIPGNCCCDCLASFFCTPCTVTQLIGQMWSNPNDNPGCVCDQTPASIV